ncbi:autism susceptibility gene 2 protein-like [Uloborus diversus]|uniref:autism susceptibility gene 2 protein-like n=1 Tax=Uloborus diversus TaxID=327109 RepID=UPI002409C31A|nr:autism susceptibility gene 2 protein-like [Uloborus diversus]
MEAKQRNAGTGNRRRRDRAARMQKRQQRQCAAAEEASENDESPPVRQKRPPTRKKRIKEPIYQEDIVDGFAFMCFKTYEDLERTVHKYEKKVSEGEGSAEEGAAPRRNSSPADHPPVLEESLPQLDKKPKMKKNNILPKVKKKNILLNNKSHNNFKECSLTNDESSRPGEELLETPRSTSRDRLSDASSHASLERGYLCDSESGDERVSEPECDLFSSKSDSSFIAKKNNPGHSQSCRSPPVLPPIHPVQNGTHHPEPSTAVAAVTAGASPASTPSAMVVGSTSPREPQIGSPAVVPVSCASPASPPSGVVPVSPPPPFSLGKESASSSNKLLNNGYEFVSDTSPPSPVPAAKLPSPNRFLHKRAPPVPSCRESVGKPAINVYDFVSDHEAPSSPDGVIFLSQSKFHHRGASPPVVPTNGREPSAERTADGHPLCASPPVLSAPVIQNSHKSALDMSIKANLAVVKTEHLPPAILPPAAAGDLRPQASPGHSRSYGIPYSTSRKVSASPVMSQPASLPLPAVPPASPARTSGTTTTTQPSHVHRSRSPAAAASHSNTPTPVPARDTHSSHSNSSLSSLSQLSTPIHKEREGGGSRSHSNSSSVAPSMGAAFAGSSAYASASSLAGLVFSKPQCWSGNSNTTNTISTSVTRSSPAPPRVSPALSAGGSSSGGMPLPPTLPPAHHTSPFGGPAPPPLLPVASHHGIFNPSSLPLEATAGPSAYRAETLFPQPSEYKKHPDLLRRELDTRFLASQDHSIPIPPPPYMQSEVQHHGQMHQQGPFMAPPPLGAPMVNQPASHLIGLSGYPHVSSLFAPGGGGSSTPFVPPAHLAALQPKINSVPKTKSMKPGKWCAMHVRIAWEIYNHQQKHKADAHKAGIAMASVKPPPSEHHLAANHLFCSLPRQHELSPFSSSILSAASHQRSFEHSSHHSTFLNPTPAHLGPFARPGYPTFAGAAPSFTGLGPLGIPGPAMLGADLRTSCLTQDPWGQRTALPFAGGSPWGGLKEEAERDRLQQERKREEERQKRAEQERREKEERERREQERREQEKREMERREQERKEQERREKERREQEQRRRELERREMERREQERREQERREQERQKERDRELRFHHQLQKSSIVMNGEIRDHHLHHPHHHAAAVAREWERAARELPRSPIVPPGNPVKYESALDRHLYVTAAPSQPRMEVKIKQERKDDEPPAAVSRSSRPPAEDRTRKRPGSLPRSEDPVSLVSSRNNITHNLGLNAMEHSRVMGLVPSPAKDPLVHHSQTSPLWGPLTPSPTVTVDHYRTREMLQARTEHDVRRFDPLVMSPRDSELSRQLTNAALDMERTAAYDRAKLLPPPLRTNESPYATPPTLPPASASSFFSPPVSPYLCTSGRSKPAAMLNGLPPPLIPCTFPVVQNFSGARTSSPMAAHKLMGPGGLALPESYFPKERREVNGHPSDFDAHLRL